MDPVDAVTTDMRAHTLTVTFDDDDMKVEEVVEALGAAGYTVPSFQRQDD